MRILDTYLTGIHLIPITKTVEEDTEAKIQVRKFVDGKSVKKSSHSFQYFGVDVEDLKEAIKNYFSLSNNDRYEIVKPQEAEHITRISFGSKHHLSFIDTTVEEVYNHFIEFFKEHEFVAHFSLRMPTPFKKPSSEVSFSVVVCDFIGNKRVSKSKSKTMYVINPVDAYYSFETYMIKDVLKHEGNEKDNSKR